MNKQERKTQARIMVEIDDTPIEPMPLWHDDASYLAYQGDCQDGDCPGCTATTLCEYCK